jgi:hypothetical protein
VLEKETTIINPLEEALAKVQNLHSNVTSRSKIYTDELPTSGCNSPPVLRATFKNDKSTSPLQTFSGPFISKKGIKLPTMDALHTARNWESNRNLNMIASRKRNRRSLVLNTINE